MTIKTLWTIILKVLGLWYGLNFLELFVFSVQSNTSMQGQGYDPSLVFYLIQAVFYVLVVFLLLFKTQYLIDKLKLEKDCQEYKIDWSHNLHAVIRIVVVFIGLLVFINAFPVFVEQVVNHYQRFGGHGQKISFWSYFESYFLIKSVVGLLLVALNQSIAGFISRLS